MYVFLIIDIEIRVILPYISSHCITSELYIRLLILGTMTLFKLIITIIIKIMTIIIVIISTTMFQNITEKLETFCFHMF